VAGACQCQEWEIVSVEPVPMKYMVVGIVYRVLGNQSQVSYGHMPSGNTPMCSSELGTRWRSVVRAFDGSETVATLGPIDMSGIGLWPPLKPVTAASGALVFPSNGAITLGGAGGYDVVPSREYDQIALWVNPGATVSTDYSGGKTIAWSTPWPGPGSGPNVRLVTAGWLDGSIPMPPGIAAVLPPLDPSDVTSILSHDPFFAASTPTSATLAADPRYRMLGGVSFDGTVAYAPPVGWSCTAPVTDANFPVLDTAEVPFGDGARLVLQSTTIGVDEACVVQTPGLVVGSSTPGCRFQADLFVDTAFGTLLWIPNSVDPACTVAP
jgi:hypothetical protein